MAKDELERIRNLFRQCSEDLLTVSQSLEDDEALQGEFTLVNDVFERLTLIETLIARRLTQ